MGGQATRIGVWNLDRGRGWKGEAQERELTCRDTDLWLLTEFNAQIQLADYKLASSAGRNGDEQQPWSAIASLHPLRPIACTHPSLAMAEVELPCGQALVANSVLPWRGAGAAWPDSDPLFTSRFERCLRQHVAEIDAARGSSAVVWGGDFNQALMGREWVGSSSGRGLLVEALSHLGLAAVTARMFGMTPGTYSIDHIALPRDWAIKASMPQTYTPKWQERPLSDHPLYLVEVPDE